MDAWCDTGYCGEKLSWELLGDTLYIGGEGKMYDYLQGQSVWEPLAWLVHSVVIEKGVTGIGKYAFWSFPALTGIAMNIFSALWSSILVELFSDSVETLCEFFCSSLDSIDSIVCVSSELVKVLFIRNFLEALNKVNCSSICCISNEGSKKHYAFCK